MIRPKATAVAGLALMLALAGCGSSHHGTAASRVSAAATSTAARMAEHLAKQCIPADEASLALSKAARTKAAACLDIPPAHRKAFEDALLNAVLRAHLGTSKGRAQFEVAALQLAARYR